MLMVYYTQRATGQDFHRKLLTLYVDDQLAEDHFAIDQTVTRATDPKQKGNYHSNVLNIWKTKRYISTIILSKPALDSIPALDTFE